MPCRRDHLNPSPDAEAEMLLHTLHQFARKCFETILTYRRGVTFASRFSVAVVHVSALVSARRYRGQVTPERHLGDSCA